MSKWKMLEEAHETVSCLDRLQSSLKIYTEYHPLLCQFAVVIPLVQIRLYPANRACIQTYHRKCQSVFEDIVQKHQ
eukprot:950587-Karenia_brevis.AAC.1